MKKDTLLNLENIDKIIIIKRYILKTMKNTSFIIINKFQGLAFLEGFQQINLIQNKIRITDTQIKKSMKLKEYLFLINDHVQTMKSYNKTNQMTYNNNKSNNNRPKNTQVLLVETHLNNKLLMMIKMIK